MEKKRGIDSFTLHILAMLFMLCDHLWATLFPAQEWMTCVGRLAFPIFAFMIAEGCYYTSNVKKYMLRLFLFAIISEIPFNLIMGSSVFYPFHRYRSLKRQRRNKRNGYRFLWFASCF